MVNKLVVPFCGHPIYKISTDDMLNKDELAFLKSIPEQSKYPYRKVKLLEGSNILNNKELHRIKNLIWNHFDDYVKNILEIQNKFYMCNSWGTIQKKGINTLITNIQMLFLVLCFMLKHKIVLLSSFLKSQ